MFFYRNAYLHVVNQKSLKINITVINYPYDMYMSVIVLLQTGGKHNSIEGKKGGIRNKSGFCIYKAGDFPITVDLQRLHAGAFFALKVFVVV